MLKGTVEGIAINGAVLSYSRAIRDSLRTFPKWFFRSARLSRIEVINTAEMRMVLANYQHDTRAVAVFPGLGKALLTKALGHEMAHGADDTDRNPHYFSSMPEWVLMHRDQSRFDLPKYRDQALEYFADIAVKYFVLGREKLRITHPRETNFLEEIVWPTLQNEFGENT